MQIGVIGLGRMGGNISRRLMKAGHTCVVFDANAEPRAALDVTIHTRWRETFRRKWASPSPLCQ